MRKKQFTYMAIILLSGLIAGMILAQTVFAFNLIDWFRGVLESLSPFASFGTYCSAELVGTSRNVCRWDGALTLQTCVAEGQLDVQFIQNCPYGCIEVGYPGDDYCAGEGELPPTCTPSCGSWSSCVNNQQTRTCTRSDCSTYTETRSCDVTPTPGTCTCEREDWTDCFDGVQMSVCINPCYDGSCDKYTCTYIPKYRSCEEEPAPEPCTPTCEGWSDNCIEGIQRRSCTSSDCSVYTEERSCPCYEWSEWSSCLYDVLLGRYEKTRYCLNQAPDATASGYALIERKSCSPVYEDVGVVASWVDTNITINDDAELEVTIDNTGDIDIIESTLVIQTTWWYVNGVPPKKIDVGIVSSHSQWKETITLEQVTSEGTPWFVGTIATIIYPSEGNWKLEGSHYDFETVEGHHGSIDVTTTNELSVDTSAEELAKKGGQTFVPRDCSKLPMMERFWCEIDNFKGRFCAQLGLFAFLCPVIWGFLMLFGVMMLLLIILNVVT